MKLVKLLLIFSFIPLLTSCWSAKEITELSIATGLGIDKKKNGNFAITIQLINPGEVTAQKGSGRAEVISYQTEAPSILEALRKISQEVPRRIYLSHVQLIILGEDTAKEGIRNTLDFLSRDHEFRSDFYILVAKGQKAEEVLRVMTPTQKIPAVSIYTQLEMSEKIWAPTVGTNLDELISALILEGKDPVITGVKVSGDAKAGETKSGMESISPPAVIKLSGIAVFNGDKLTGWLNMNESKGFNYIINNVKNTAGHSKCPDGGKFIVEVMNVDSKMKSKIVNDKPKIIIDMYIEENIAEVQCSLDLSKTKTVEALEKIAEERIITLSKLSVKKAKKLNSDIFGFGEVIHRQHPNEWKKMKKNWKEIFPDIEVEYKVKVDIRRIGTITNSIYDQVKE